MAAWRRAQGSARQVQKEARGWAAGPRTSGAPRASWPEAVISHVVLFQPKPDLAQPERDALVAAFERAVREVPDVRGVRVGRRVTHGAGYETAAPNLADILVVIDFDDLSGLQAYLRHPAHAELGARFNQAFSSGLVCDFEVGELRT